MAFKPFKQGRVGECVPSASEPLKSRLNRGGGLRGRVFCEAFFFFFFNFAKLSIFTLVVSNAFAFEYILTVLLLYEAYAFLRKLT